MEVVTDGCPLRGGRSSRAGRRRYLPVAGARAARRTSGAPRHHRGTADSLAGRFWAEQGAAGRQHRPHGARSDQRSPKDTHPPYAASVPMPIPGIVSGFRVQWIVQVLQRGRSASARRVLLNCLWCGILYRVRDPGDSRRASLKLVPLVPMGDPGDSRDPGASRRASLKLVLLAPMGDPGNSRDPGDSRRASLKRHRCFRW